MKDQNLEEKINKLNGNTLNIFNSLVEANCYDRFWCSQKKLDYCNLDINEVEKLTYLDLCNHPAYKDKFQA